LLFGKAAASAFVKGVRVRVSIRV
jgi:hypothetical protein